MLKEQPTQHPQTAPITLRGQSETMLEPGPPRSTSRIPPDSATQSCPYTKPTARARCPTPRSVKTSAFREDGQQRCSCRNPAELQPLLPALHQLPGGPASDFQRKKPSAASCLLHQCCVWNEYEPHEETCLHAHLHKRPNTRYSG